MRPPLFLAILLALFSLVRASDPAATRAELIQADEAFCASAARDGVPAAFTAFAAPEATFLDTEPGKLHGAAAVAAHFEGWPGGKLTWQPRFADAAASGDLGYTWGTWQVERTLPDGSVKRATGKYVTLWRRQPDGTWKYVLDTGVSDPPPPTPPSPASAPKS